MKLDLLTNATVIDDAIRFASDKSIKKLKPLANSNEDNKESNESVNHEIEDQLEEQEEES
jgi:hypothetical protein